MSSTTATRKPPQSSNNHRRSQPPSLTGSSSRPENRSPTPSSASNPGTVNGPVRRNTIRESGHRPTGSISSTLSARSAVKTRPLSHDETELETAAMVEDLRSRLLKKESAAEAAAEEHAKQLKAMQMRLDEAHTDYMRIEDAMHAKDEMIERMEMQIKELTSTKLEQENIYEAERTAAQQEKEELLDREEELNNIIQRLKDTLSLRQPSPNGERRDSSSSSSTFAPTGHSQILSPNDIAFQQRDKVIESLRLEIAESQLSLAQAHHLQSTKVQELEQQLLESRMTNARLMEDNESFQGILSSFTLSGDFSRGDYLSTAFSDPSNESEVDQVKKVEGSPRHSLALNLADELNEADHDEDGERVRKLENEVKQLKEQNRTMSSYINNIIERILQHKGSEGILDKTALGGPPPGDVDKPLPPKPEEEKRTGILQRTKSLSTHKPQPKPDGTSMQRSQSLSESKPSHQRTRSDAPTSMYPGTVVINNIYRGEGMITPRTTKFYSGTGGESYTRSNYRARDSNTSVDSGVSDAGFTEASSVPSPPHPPTPMGPIAGNKLRPLTLVQKNVSNGMISPPLGSGGKITGDYLEQADDVKKVKRQSKRLSWLGWLNRGKDEDAPSAMAESVVFEGKDVE